MALYDLRPPSCAAALSTGLPDGLLSEISGGVHNNCIFGLQHLMRHPQERGYGESLAPRAPQTDPSCPNLDEDKTLSGSQTLLKMAEALPLATGFWSEDGA